MDAPKFEMGQVVATRHALDTLTHYDLHTALTRHARGDWGDCCPEDARENDISVERRLRIFSVYHGEAGQKYYVITEADRSSTCVLLAEEY